MSLNKKNTHLGAMSRTGLSCEFGALCASRVGFTPVVAGVSMLTVCLLRWVVLEAGWIGIFVIAAVVVVAAVTRVALLAASLRLGNLLELAAEASLYTGWV